MGEKFPFFRHNLGGNAHGHVQLAASHVDNADYSNQDNCYTLCALSSFSILTTRASSAQPANR